MKRSCSHQGLVLAAFCAFGAANGGNTAIIFGASAPVVLGAVGLSLDYAKWSGAHSKLQAIADQAALAAARELKLAGATAPKIQAAATMMAATAMTDTPTAIQNLAAGFAAAAAGADPNIPTVNTIVPADLSSVTVELSQTVPTILAQPLGLPFVTVTAKAKARVTSGLPLCLLTLDPVAKADLLIGLGSNITATGCAVRSNSKDPESITVQDSSVLKSQSACTSGGFKGNAANFLVQPQTGCPAYPDPLAAKPQPVVPSTCDYNSKVITGGTVTISPGTYCGGLNITLGADVTASPGVYIIKNGALTLSLGAKLKGSSVGFFLTGTGNLLAFTPSSTVDLSAPIDGPMAGMLLWEDRTSSGKMPHILASQNARNLLGTLYFPNGQLAIGSPNPVADASFYTIIVARYLQILGSPNLVLNSNYGASVVPVPSGLGPTSVGSVALEY